MPGAYSKSWLQRAVAGATAYVLAMQIILAGALAAQMVITPSSAGFICHSAGFDNQTNQRHNPGHPPDRHAPCGICTFAGFAPILLDATSIVSYWSRQTNVRFVQADIAILLVKRHEPRTSQGPPLAV